MESLLPFCRSEKEKEWVEAIIKHGGIKPAAMELRVPSSTMHDRYKRIKNDAIKRGWFSDCPSTPTHIPLKSEVKILIIDIETSPTKAYVWKMWKENIGQNQVIDHSYIMCFSAKWIGSNDIVYSETRTEDDLHITKMMLKLLDEANIVIAHNADRFDIPKINAAAIKHGLTPPSPYKVIDTLKVAKRHFKFERNTLAHIADYLGCTAKLDHAKFSGFELWKECLDGNDDAWQEMMQYNIQDVHTLEEVYIKLRPWIKEHPNVAINIESDVMLCSKCGSNNLILNGHTFTDISKFELFKCQDCGGFSRSRATKYPKMIRNELLTTVR